MPGHDRAAQRTSADGSSPPEVSPVKPDSTSNSGRLAYVREQNQCVWLGWHMRAI